MHPRLRVRIGLSHQVAAKQKSFLPQRRCYALEANDLDGMLKQKSLWETFPTPIQKLAVFAEHARSHNYQVPQFSKASTGDFDQKKAYHVTAAIRQLREMNGEVVAGRKLGFTNKDMWSQYGVDEANWSYVWRTTTVDLANEQMAGGKSVLANISHLGQMEPKIEPEIIFGLNDKVIKSTMSDAELLECVDWVSHGFEIVASIFPGWKFSAADATAAYALHGLLIVGPRLPIHSQDSTALLESLKNFTVELYQNGQKVDAGTGSNVLGSPVKALRYLTELLENDEHNQPLQPGEIVSTGTLTRALGINHGDTWSTKISGIELPGLAVRFRLQ